MRLNRSFIYFIIVFFIFCYNDVLSQIKCGSVVNKQTKKGIDYATITCIGCTSGTYTDDNGLFCFQIPEKTDSVIIIAMGYKKIIFSKKQFLEKTELLMEENVINLQNVIVSAKKNKQNLKEIGYFSKKWFQFLDGFSPNSSTKLAVFIPNTSQKQAYIEKILYHLKPESSDIAQSFRLRCMLFKNGKNNLPESELIQSNIIVEVKPEEETIEKSITDLNILLPKEGVWVSIETVGFTDLAGNYQPLSVGRIGEVIYKQSKKIKIDKVRTISPRFAISKESKYATTMKIWQMPWQYFRFSQKLNTLMFGLEVSILD